jgi:hypothetical protein
MPLVASEERRPPPSSEDLARARSVTASRAKPGYRAAVTMFRPTPSGAMSAPVMAVPDPLGEAFEEAVCLDGVAVGQGEIELADTG